MGRSIRSKIGKRLRTAKRQRADAMVYTPKLHEHYDSLKRVMEGRAVNLKTPKNAFKYPDDEGAAFPQHEIMKPIDYRAGNLPMAQYAYRGNRRKYTGEELEYMKNLAKSSHPQMEVLAGGGAVMAKTGKRVSLKEASLLATAADNPEAAALAVAGPSNSTSAVAAAVQEDEATLAQSSAALQDVADDVDMVAGAPDSDPVNAVDHTRLPVVKDTRRAKRTGEARARSNAVLKSKTAPAVGAKAKEKKRAKAGSK